MFRSPSALHDQAAGCEFFSHLVEAILRGLLFEPFGQITHPILKRDPRLSLSLHFLRQG
jgi:hypothetical protein